MIMQKLKSVLNYLVTTELKATPFSVHFLLAGFGYFITNYTLLSWVSMILISISGYIINDLLAQYLNPDKTEGSDND